MKMNRRRRGDPEKLLFVDMVRFEFKFFCGLGFKFRWD